MIQSDKELILSFLHTCGCSSDDIKSIITSYTLEDILSGINGGRYFFLKEISEKQREKIQKRIQENSLEDIRKTLAEKNIRVITEEDEEYPDKLRQLYHPPYILYLRGNLNLGNRSLGIVGSRKNTPYGKRILETIIPELVEEQVTIISGGAYGIDGIAHSLTLENDGNTISVFGCGVDIYYPASHHSLFERILNSGGGLLSIFPIGTKPMPYMFPMRNEIVVGLSDAIIIPEAGIKSGTLITAKLALENNRDVFAVPGDIFRDTSAGTNMLIISGQAQGIYTASDILSSFPDYEISQKNTSKEDKKFDSETQSLLYDAIAGGYDTKDLLQEHTNITIENITYELGMMEIFGYIHLNTLDGKYSTL